MSAKGNDLASRAKRLQSTRRAGVPASSSAAEASARPDVPRATPVRITTDIAPQTHRFLVEYASGVAQVIGKPRVPGSEVIRALIAELETSPHLQAVIQSRLRPEAQ